MTHNEDQHHECFYDAPRRQRGGPVYPVVFTAQSKTELGWTFLWLASSGRLRDYARDGSREQAMFWSQLDACRFEASGVRGSHLESGECPTPGHDDVVVSAVLLCALPEELLPRIARGGRRKAERE